MDMDFFDSDTDQYRTLGGLFCCFPCCREHHNVKALLCGSYYCSFLWRFQTGMMVLGWVDGISVIGFISADGHWIAFILQLVVGVKMVGEDISGEEEEAHIDRLWHLPLTTLPLPTSIDALAVGFSSGIL
jgi:putative Mn2+ efflux pump MntP